MGSEYSDIVIDVGNTRMKVALYVNERLDGVLSFSNQALKHVEKLLESSGASRCIMSTVKAINPSLYKLLDSRLDMLVMDAHTKVPIAVGYDTPETLGSDRLANAVGAAKLYPGQNVLVVDFGTCIKYDLVNAEGVFCGGAIAPGIAMRFKSMSKMTGKLPHIKQWSNGDAVWPGKSTHGSMVAGVVQGIQAEMAQYINTASDVYGNLTVISTGGDFVFFEKAFKNIIFAHPYLTLEGLHEILKFNMD
jgi:type III pantothenate kinase